jgi:hypothetical protein
MESQNIARMNLARVIPAHASGVSQKDNDGFQTVLDAENSNIREGNPITPNTTSPLRVSFLPPEPQTNPVSNSKAIAAYKKHENLTVENAELSNLQKYKDDQLLSNPGGDHYYLEKKEVVPDLKEQESFLGRVGKDFSDAFGNLKNFFQNLLFGAKIRYRDEDNQIQEDRQRGLVGSMVDVFKDLGSALSFGMWRPDGEQEPLGFGDRLGFSFSKMKEAIFGDLIQGVGGSAIRMGEDLIFAGWNLLESIPDSTLGNFQTGKKLTTAFFDNGQVVLDYLTDILPTGDAWVRVHSPNLKELKPPILHNINMPERQTEDVGWRYVRNTPFRKAIETVGSILVDILTFKFLGHSKVFSDERHEKS